MQKGPGLTAPSLLSCYACPLWLLDSRCAAPYARLLPAGQRCRDHGPDPGTRVPPPQTMACSGATARLPAPLGPTPHTPGPPPAPGLRRALHSQISVERYVNK